MEPSRCPTCGRALSDHDRDIRFRLPQPVLEASLETEELAGRTWGNDVLMQVQGIGAFVRVLVPVRLTGGFGVVFGAWLGVHPDDLRRAWEVWNGPEYMGLELSGFLANELPPWRAHTCGKPLAASPRSPDELPYACESSDPVLQNILTQEWNHDLVLSSISESGAEPAWADTLESRTDGADSSAVADTTTIPWPFPDNRFPDALLVYVMRTVVEGELPALLVSHDSDNEWSVADGVTDPNVEGAVVLAHMRHVIDRDPSIEELASLPMGHDAYRETVAERWQIEPSEVMSPDEA